MDSLLPPLQQSVWAAEGRVPIWCIGVAKMVVTEASAIGYSPGLSMKRQLDRLKALVAGTNFCEVLCLLRQSSMVS